MNDAELLKQKCLDTWWRLNNLYWIVSKRGNRIKFKPNWAQTELYNNIWYCNIILKARQLGLSTMIILMLLDKVLFKD